MMIVNGRLQTRKWEDKQGNKRTSVEIVAENVYFGNSKPENSVGGYPPPAPGRPASAAPYPSQSIDPPPAQIGFTELEDDDGELPF
jgi:single-strand DNA-binding protein